MSSIFLDQIAEKHSIGALALGSFDGVHRGHAALLKTAIELSDKHGREAGALCFSPNPKSYFSSEECPFSQIYSLDQNVEALLSLGTAKVFVKKFDQACSQMSAESFLDYVLTRVSFHNLVVGFDFKFGKARSGGHENLRNWCVKNKVKLVIVSEEADSDQKISSTRIKSLLANGDVESAEVLLGRVHSYSGTVSSDQGLGKKIGFPTLNLKLSLETAIAKGVYVSLLRKGKEQYFGLSNVGLRPTVSESMTHLVLETHILSPETLDLKQGDKIRVELKRFVRPEKKFASIEELKSQIALDVALVESLKGQYSC